MSPSLFNLLNSDKSSLQWSPSWNHPATLCKDRKVPLSNLPWGRRWLPTSRFIKRFQLPFSRITKPPLTSTWGSQFPLSFWMVRDLPIEPNCLNSILSNELSRTTKSRQILVKLANRQRVDGLERNGAIRSQFVQQTSTFQSCKQWTRVCAMQTRVTGLISCCLLTSKVCNLNHIDSVQWSQPVFEIITSSAEVIPADKPVFSKADKALKCKVPTVVNWAKFKQTRWCYRTTPLTRTNCKVGAFKLVARAALFTWREP